ncbi:MAG: lipo-like protein [Pseudomonadota bacterium]
MQEKKQNLSLFERLLEAIGNRMTRKLVAKSSGYKPYTPSDFETLSATLKPGDVLLVEGNQHVSAVIKYLTQSTWSHACIYVGDALDCYDENGERHCLVEVNLGEGCVSVPLRRYETYNTRICRPVGLTDDDREKVVGFMVEKLGLQYDVKNIFDLMRYFFPVPPVPVRWRRRMLALGSSSPTKAICSSLIAQAYQSVKYPILPEITLAPGRTKAVSDYSRSEIMHIRHHTLFAPRDFDLSPYFEVIKPSIQHGFNYKSFLWSGHVSDRDVLRLERHDDSDHLETEEAGKKKPSTE